MSLYGKPPDDPFYEHINPYLKVWLYESWLHDKELEAERLKSQAILIGSFTNPEMANRMIKQDNPDFETTDVEETSKMVRDEIVEAERERRRKKKRKTRKVVS